MSRNRDAKPVALSTRAYERLLALYPLAYRQEFGPSMTQLFRDQCRDAWAKGRGWGLAILWLRISVDLARTSSAEHLQNLNQRISMHNKALLEFCKYPTLRATFLALFGLVFVLVLGSSLLLAFLAPEQYASTARIKVERNVTDATPVLPTGCAFGIYDPYFVQTQFELIQSEAVLGGVAKKLNLSKSWGTTSTGGTGLNEADTIKLLRQRLELRPVRNTSLIEVRVYSKEPKEASDIANALAETYREFESGQKRSATGMEKPRLRSVEIVDTAVPGLRPVRPNKPFTLFLGIFGGVLLASVVGGVGALLVLISRRLSRPPTGAA